jgi:hypothetical protein
MPPPGWKNDVEVIWKGRDSDMEYRQYTAMGPFGPVKIVWEHKGTIGSHDDITAWCMGSLQKNVHDFLHICSTIGPDRRMFKRRSFLSDTKQSVDGHANLFCTNNRRGACRPDVKHC